MKTMVKRNVFPTFLDEIFNEPFLRNALPASHMISKGQVPALNLKENDFQFTIEMAVPGMKKSDFKIEVEDQILTISSVKNEEQEKEQANWKRKEFGFYSFKRNFELPEDAVFLEQISAQYEDGVLRVNVPKKSKEEKVKKVIEVGVV